MAQEFKALLMSAAMLQGCMMGRVHGMRRSRGQRLLVTFSLSMAQATVMMHTCKERVALQSQANRRLALQ
jgi:hypothetical protein